MGEKDLQKLEYYKILNYIKKFCSSPATEEFIENQVRPERNRIKVLNLIKDTQSFLNLLREGIAPPIEEFEKINHLIKRAKLEGAILSAGELLKILKVLQIFRNLKNFLKAHKERFKNLEEHYKELKSFLELEKLITENIDEKGIVKDSASYELMKIRKRIRELENRIKNYLEKFMQENPHYITDNIITLRQGRYVIPVKTSIAKRLKGISHGISSTGKTTFFEPAGIVALNNQCVELREEEERKIREILKKITEKIGKRAEEIKESYERLIYLDWTYAKAKFGIKIEGNFPIISEDEIELLNTKHPLLILTKKAEEVVPIDLKLESQKRGLIITGPNTGGKTVALKTLGLNVLMFQTGIPIPCSAHSKIKIFSNVFTDIGDEQNIEQNLSTFAGHIKNIASFINKCDSETLVLIDELGAGTDPVEGSAIGLALLEYFEQVGSYVVITTHHTPIKLYALSSNYYTPASVLFDEESLKPLYKLAYHTVGGSHALEIAQKLGLRKEIIERAKEYLHKEISPDYEKATKELQKYAYEYYTALEEIEKLKKQLLSQEEQIKKLKEELEREKYRRWKGVIREARDFLREFKEKAMQRLEEIKDKQSAKEILKELEEELTEHEKKVQETIEIEVGKRYEYRGKPALVLQLKGNKALIMVEGLKIWVSKNELQSLKHPIKEEGKVEIKVFNKVPSGKGKWEIKLLGKRREEAREELMKFLDKAHLSGAKIVKIIHGIGNGVLKKVCEEVLEETPYVVFYREGTPKEGGAGVTIAQLE